MSTTSGVLVGIPSSLAENQLSSEIMEASRSNIAMYSSDEEKLQSGDPENQIRYRVRNALNNSAQNILTGGHSEFVRNLTDTLRALKAGVDHDIWRDVVIPEARHHSLASLVHECPLTQHSFLRPRGYPGDAGLLDLIYRHDSARGRLNKATVAGRAVFDFTVEVSACEAVRQRRTLLGQRIDEVATKRAGTEILSVACGHLREAELSKALAAGKVGRFVATDQDRSSLNVVAGYAASISPVIETKQLSVRDFLGVKHGLCGFDFIYAAGLYDYLDERLAARLTRRLFSLLKPGGRLLVANFLTDIWEMPYMEAFMDWHLLYRSEAQIRAFASEIAPEELNDTIYFEDATGCVGHLEMFRV